MRRVGEGDEFIAGVPYQRAKRRARLRFTLGVLLLFAVAYLAVSLLTYGLRHPELTQAQVLLDAKRAFLWR